MLTDRSSFFREPQKRVLSLYFDSLSPHNAKRSKIKAFPKVSLVSLTLRLALFFNISDKIKVISLCWFTKKEWDLCKCFCAFKTVLFKQKLLQLQWNLSKVDTYGTEAFVCFREVWTEKFPNLRYGCFTLDPLSHGLLLPLIWLWECRMVKKK